MPPPIALTCKIEIGLLPVGESWTMHETYLLKPSVQYESLELILMSIWKMPSHFYSKKLCFSYCFQLFLCSSRWMSFWSIQVKRAIYLSEKTEEHSLKGTMQSKLYNPVIFNEICMDCFTVPMLMLLEKDWTNFAIWSYHVSKDVAILKHQLAGSVSVSAKLKYLDRKIESGFSSKIITKQVQAISISNSEYLIIFLNLVFKVSWNFFG